MNDEYCKQHKWKMWLPTDIYKCSGCGIFKFKLERK